MKKKSQEKNYLSAWNQVMKPEMLKKVIDGSGLVNHMVVDVECVSVRSFDEAGCMVNTTCGDRPVKIYLSFLIGAPHWSHFMDLVYGNGKAADMQIIMCSEDFVESKNDAPHGNLYGIGQLAQYYNERGCHVIVLQLKILEQILKGETDKPEIEVFQELIDKKEGHDNGHDEIPTKRQLQESEFWAEYYLTSCGVDFENISECIPHCDARYFIKNNCEVVESFNDNGFSIRIVGPVRCDFLKWLWNQGQALITDEFQDCKAFLLGSEDMPSGVDFRLIDLSMTKLLALNSSKKRYYAERVYVLESMFLETIVDIEEEYEKFQNSNLR